nr:PhnR [Burkholderia sp.]
MKKIEYPGNDDLRGLVRFSTEDGLIWLGESRMLLLHVATMAGLRRELILSVGVDDARRTIIRMGYEAGLRDAEIVRRIRRNDDDLDAYIAGPQLFMLEGGERVFPLRVEMDVQSGSFYGEFRSENSWEAESHLREFGQTDYPVCWMRAGYASGYTSGFLGRQVLMKEIECAACGADHCTLVGKPAEEWEDEEDYASYFTPEQAPKTSTRREKPTAARNGGVILPGLVGRSAGFRQACDLIARAAGTDVTVLLLGETGVGKERFVRALHQLNRRRDQPFVAVNCAAIPHELIESDLFGVEKGAYTGATASRRGKFERADGGTLFLDEIGEMPLAAQAKLLRALQEGEIERLGDERVRKVNVRVVAATNIDLTQAVKDGRFRADLFYRLCVFPIHIPPLRERLADLQPLIDTLIERFSVVHNKPVRGVSDMALRLLKRYTWPGNIRELENMLERAIILAPEDGWIEAVHLSTPLESARAGSSGIGRTGALESASVANPSHQSLVEHVLNSGLSFEELETLVLQESVNLSGGSFARAARALGMTSPQLRYRLRKRRAATLAAPEH